MLRILLAQRNPVDLYPPVLQQVELLGELGDVTVLEADIVPRASQAGKQRGTPIPVPGVDRALRAPSALRSWAQFSWNLWRTISRVDVAVAYEPEAAAVLLARRLSSAYRIVHLHEITDRAGYAQSISALGAFSYMIRFLHRADLVIVPDPYRARLVRKQTGGRVKPMVVMNCPPLLQHLPESRLIPYLHERGLSTHRIVHYQGSIGPHHNLESTVSSMAGWPEDSVFVLVGGGREDFQEQLRSIARHTGVDKRLVFVGRVPYREVMSWARGAALGLTVLDTRESNWRYAAGASNKRFEYLALGVPQITNEGPGVAGIFSGVGRFVPYGDREALASAVAEYLLDDRLRQEAFARARKRHLTIYNYPAQFEQVLARIRGALAVRGVHIA